MMGMEGHGSEEVRKRKKKSQASPVSTSLSLSVLAVPTSSSGLIAGDSSVAKLPPAGTQIKQGVYMWRECV